jgi:hypothetical protein
LPHSEQVQNQSDAATMNREVEREGGDGEGGGCREERQNLLATMANTFLARVGETRPRDESVEQAHSIFYILHRYSNLTLKEGRGEWLLGLLL